MSIRRAALWSIASHYSSFAIQFATSVIIARFFLLPVDVGMFSIALAAAMMVSIFQDMGISRFVTGQPQMREENVREYAAVATGIGWLVAVAVAIAAWPLAQFYGEPRLTGLMLIIAGAYALMPLAIVPVALLLRAMDLKALFFVNGSSALAGAAASIGTAAAGAGPASLAWGMLAAALVRLVAAQLHRKVWPRRPKDPAIVKPMISFGGASFVLSLSGALGVRSQDLIVGAMLGLRETGLFSRATGLAGQMSMLVVAAVNGVFYPAFAKKRDAGEDLREPYLRLIACNTGVQWAAAVGLALAAEPLVHLLYGPNWDEVAPLLRWTALAEIFFIAIPLQMDIPILLGRIRQLVWVNLADTVMTIAILAAFCLWGLEAAAQSRIIVGALWFAIYGVFIGRLLHLRPIELAGNYLRSASCALAAGMPLLIARYQGDFSADMGFLALLALCLAGGLCWFITLPLVRHPLWQEVRLAYDRIALVRS